LINVLYTIVLVVGDGDYLKHPTLYVMQQLHQLSTLYPCAGRRLVERYRSLFNALLSKFLPKWGFLRCSPLWGVLHSPFQSTSASPSFVAVKLSLGHADLLEPPSQLHSFCPHTLVHLSYEGACW